jgi:hypothetical protein
MATFHVYLLSNVKLFFLHNLVLNILHYCDGKILIHPVKPAMFTQTFCLLVYFTKACQEHHHFSGHCIETDSTCTAMNFTRKLILCARLQSPVKGNFRNSIRM